MLREQLRLLLLCLYFYKQMRRCLMMLFSLLVFIGAFQRKMQRCAVHPLHLLLITRPLTPPPVHGQNHELRKVRLARRVDGHLLALLRGGSQCHPDGRHLAWKRPHWVGRRNCHRPPLQSRGRTTVARVPRTVEHSEKFWKMGHLRMGHGGNEPMCRAGLTRGHGWAPA